MKYLYQPPRWQIIGIASAEVIANSGEYDLEPDWKDEE